jgi:carnitine 3-dehydrogenase
LSFHAEPEAALAGAEFVQESAPERKDLKRALLARLDAVLDPEIVIASSSSGLLMSECRSIAATPNAASSATRSICRIWCLCSRWSAARKPTPRLSSGRSPSTPLSASSRFPSAARFRACRQPAAAGVVAGGGASGGRTGGERRRRRYGDQRRVGATLGLDGTASDFHLAGGVGGIDHFLDQFATPMASWWESLGNPALTPELRQRLAHGIADVAAGRDIAELEARRDRFLVDLLALKAARE